MGGLNVAMISALLKTGNREGLFSLTTFQRGLIVIFFAFGTVHFTLSTQGKVWFLSQLIGFFCLTLAYYIALNCRGWGAFALVGITLGMALNTRVHLVFVGIWPIWTLIQKHKDSNKIKIAGYLIAGMVPIIIAVGLLFSYNYIRFGSMFDFGLDYHQMGAEFIEDYKKYGAFNLHYLPINLYYQYINYPFPLRHDSLMGGSLFLLSPLFFAIFWGLRKQKTKYSNWILLISILITSIPILFLMGTGYVQFGPRYTLDFTIPLLFLTANGIEHWKDQRSLILVLISIVHYFAGLFILSKL